MTGHQKKRSDTIDMLQTPSHRGGHITSFSTASSLSRQPLAGRGYTSVPREASPPASAYFSGYTATEPEPIATGDASSHFAYSTTLRRHSTEGAHHLGSGNSVSTLQSLGRIVSHEGAGLLDRFVANVAGHLPGEEHGSDDSRPIRSGRIEKPDEETPSSIYAHWSAEVCLSFSHMLNIDRTPRKQQDDFILQSRTGCRQIPYLPSELRTVIMNFRLRLRNPSTSSLQNLYTNNP
jgi:P-type Ca2+ transporter type 2C